MIPAYLLIYVLLFVQTAPPDTAAARDVPIPTIQDLHDMYDQGDFRACLQQASRIMRLPVAKQKLDADEVNLLRAKSLIALRDGRSAQRALELVLASSNQQLVTEARALKALVRASPGLKYVPRSPPKRDAIDFTEPANLKAAMLALFDDQLAAIAPDVRTALAAKNLAPMMPLTSRVLDLYALEQTATGASDRTTAIGSPLGEHARELIKNELTEKDRDVATMEKLANQWVDVPARRNSGHGGWWWNSGVTRRGLISDERDQLSDLVTYLESIEQTAHQGQDISRAVNGNVAAWDEVIAEAGRVKQHAQDVLDAEGIRTNTTDSR